MRTTEAPSPTVVRRAADWAALLDDPRVGDDMRRACDDWCNEHPTHRLAYDRMRAVNTRFSALDDAQRRTVSSASTSPPRRARAIGGGLACRLAIAGAAWFASNSFEVRSLWPEHRTSIGEQLTIALSEGSTLIADSNTRLNAYAEAPSKREVM